MRIGLVCPYSMTRPGGVQNHVLGLARWLVGEGHEAHLLAPGTPPEGMLADYGLAPVQFTSAGPGMPVPFNGSIARINFGGIVAWRVAAWLNTRRLEVVHVHEPMTPSVSFFSAAFATAPVVATFHTANDGLPAMAVAQRLVPHVNRRIVRAIAVSSVARQVAHRPATVIGNGIRVSDHSLAPATGAWRGGERPVLTFVGRYSEPRKGFGVLRGALPTLLAAHPELRVQVVGHGLPVNDDRITFLGSLDDQARNQVLATSDVYLAPQTGRESFGIVLLEALASGAPVVASDLPAFREVVTDGWGPVAQLFRPGDEHDLNRAVLESLAQPRDLNLARGRAQAERFDWSAIGPKVLDEYRQALAGRALVPQPLRPRQFWSVDRLGWRS